MIQKQLNTAVYLPGKLPGIEPADPTPRAETTRQHLNSSRQLVSMNPKNLYLKIVELYFYFVFLQVFSNRTRKIFGSLDNYMIVFHNTQHFFKQICEWKITEGTRTGTVFNGLSGLTLSK